MLMANASSRSLIMSGSTERQSPELWAGMLSRVWVPRRVGVGPNADPTGFPRPSVFLSSLCSCPLPLSTVSGSSVAPGDISSFPVAFRAKGTSHVMDLSASQGGSRKHSSDPCFCNLCNRATNPYNNTASLPASRSGRRWRRWSHLKPLDSCLL